MPLDVGNIQSYKDIRGTELSHHTNFGKDIGSETIKEARRKIEKFEIGYGQQMESIQRYSNDIRRKIAKQNIAKKIKNNNTDNNNYNTNNTNNNNNDNNNNNNNTINTNNNNYNKNDDINYNNNVEWNKINEIYNINESFNGSQIIEQAEKVLTIKSTLIALLFIIIYRPFFVNISRKISKKSIYISPIVIQAIIFALCFYLIEKYLLKY